MIRTAGRPQGRAGRCPRVPRVIDRRRRTRDRTRAGQRHWKRRQRHGARKEPKGRVPAASRRGSGAGGPSGRPMIRDRRSTTLSPRAGSAHAHLTFLTGIWPPGRRRACDARPGVLRASSLARGHEVVVVTMGDGGADRAAVRGRRRRGGRDPFPFGTRRSPWSLREGRDARTCVYATATYAAAAAASVARPRAARREARLRPGLRAGTRATGSSTASLEEFQLPAGRRVEALKAARTRALRRARAIVVPSAYLARIAAAWGLDAGSDHGAPQPRPGIESTRRRLDAGDLRVRRPADAAEEPRPRDRRRRPGAEGTTHRSSATAPIGATRGVAQPRAPAESASPSSERFRAPRPSRFSREPTPA